MTATVTINGKKVDAKDIGITLKRSDDLQSTAQSFERFGCIAMQVSVNLKIFRDRMRKLMRAIGYTPSANAAGYIIVNHRGRNKLIDIQRLRRGKA